MAKNPAGRLEADGLGVLVSATEAAAFLGLPAAGIHAVLRHRGVQPVRILGVLIMRRGRRTFYRLKDVETLALQIRPVSQSETAQGGAPGPEGDPWTLGAFRKASWGHLRSYPHNPRYSQAYCSKGFSSTRDKGSSSRETVSLGITVVAEAERGLRRPHGAVDNLGIL